MQTASLRIGTRGSPLALAQAQEVRSALMRAHGLPAEAFEIVVITTSGDRIQDRPLAALGGKGLFTKEIEEALLAGGIDIAVHSSKDMPVLLPEGLEFATFLPREDVRDAFIGAAAPSIEALPPGATVGSSSPRRQALIRRARPDLRVETFRGNVQTRLRKLSEGVADATILALAGLKRLGLTGVATQLMPVERFPPAPGQGAIGVESRIGDRRVAAMLAAIHDVPTGLALACERAFLAVLDGTCRSPIAGLAEIAAGRLRFRGLILSLDGAQAHEIEREGPQADAVLIGGTAGEEVRDLAGTRFFESWS